MATAPGAPLPPGVPPPYVGSYVNTAQTVTSQFVQQFYTVLHNAPKQLHRFYSDQSTFSVGNASGDGAVHTAVGQQGIHAAVQGLGFEEAVTEIYSVDSQPSALGGVVIQVSGTLQGKNKAKRPFVQTFFLAVQEKGYFVLNDIFNFLPMGLTGLGPVEPQGPPTPEQHRSPSPAAPAPAPVPVPAPVPAPAPVSAPLPVPAPTPIAVRPPSGPGTEAAREAAPTPASAVPHAAVAAGLPVPAAKAPGVIVGADNAGGLQPASERTGRAEAGTPVPATSSPDSSTESLEAASTAREGPARAPPAATTSGPDAASAAAPTQPGGAMSYADRLRSGAAAAAPAAPKARGGAAPARTSSNSSTSSTSARREEGGASAGGPSGAAGAPARPASTPSAAGEEPTPNGVVRPNPSVFIREIPPTVTQEALEAALRAFGELRPGGVKLKQQRGRDSYAFVDFAAPAAAAAVLERGLQLDGRRVVVAEKRARLFFQGGRGASERGGPGGRGGPRGDRGPGGRGLGRGAAGYAGVSGPPPPHVQSAPMAVAGGGPPVAQAAGYPVGAYPAAAHLGPMGIKMMPYPRPMAAAPPPFGWQVGRGGGPRGGRGAGGRGRGGAPPAPGVAPPPSKAAQQPPPPEA